LPKGKNIETMPVALTERRGDKEEGLIFETGEFGTSKRREVRQTGRRRDPSKKGRGIPRIRGHPSNQSGAETDK